MGEARDGRDAVSQTESLNPDVISMDINMPHMDGLQATEVIMSRNPRPIVIVSSESREGADATLRALELGAIDFVPKPTNAIDLDMNSVREELCRKLKIASRSAWFARFAITIMVAETMAEATEQRLHLRLNRSQASALRRLPCMEPRSLRMGVFRSSWLRLPLVAHRH